MPGNKGLINEASRGVRQPRSKRGNNKKRANDREKEYKKLKYRNELIRERNVMHTSLVTPKKGDDTDFRFARSIWN
jgi:hypothetical protein